MSDAPTYEQLQQLVGELSAQVVELERIVREQGDEIAELKRRSLADSSNSSRPPSSDAPWSKKPARKRSSRSRSGRKPGKQPGASSSSRSLLEGADDTLEIQPDRCRCCDTSLAGAEESGRQRRQVVDVRSAPPPRVTEYQRISKVCPCCGAVTTPGWDDEAVPLEHADTVAAPGSPVRIGPETVARAALLTGAHYLPVGRARDLLEALTAIDVSPGFLAGIRGRAARRLEKQFLAPHAEAAGQCPAAARRRDPWPCRWFAVLRPRGLHRVPHPHACRRPLRQDHRRRWVLDEFTGVLVRDGYAGYEHITAVHAWCGAHILRDLRSISDADPDAQVRAIAMATTLLDANRAAREARERGAERLDEATLNQIRNHYLARSPEATPTTNASTPNSPRRHAPSSTGSGDSRT